MMDFQLLKPAAVPDAIRAASAAKTAQQGAEVRFIGGGTTLLDLMKLDVERPSTLVDINRLDMSRVEKQVDGSLRVGALVRNSDLAHDANVTAMYPVLTQALLSGASAQLRNMATTGGNLLQRTRCTYFRDVDEPMCNKRTPGSGCAAIVGFHRTHAILGTSEQCIATHPSDMAVAMMALEAKVHVQGVKGERELAIGEFYRVPGATPHLENVLEPGDLITHVTLPAPLAGSASVYLKLRDRASYEFALASAAVVVQAQGGRIAHARVAMGGVGTKPWRMPEAERALVGKAPLPSVFMAAAEAGLRGAKPHPENEYKVELAKRCLVRALTTATVKA